jgi:RNA polymerase sigma-70 factor (ECF subfamily)
MAPQKANMKNPEFEKLLGALRERDEEAAAELVRRYEPLIRRVIRMRLTDPRLRRVFDSIDICQSVMANFFDEVALGQLAVTTETHLRNFLVRMATNKLIDKVRREQHSAGGLPEEWEPAADDPSPSQVVAQRELAQAIQNRLSAKERWLAEKRAEGRSWVELAQETGETTDSLRMMHARALARIRAQLHDEEVNRAR